MYNLENPNDTYQFKQTNSNVTMRPTTTVSDLIESTYTTDLTVVEMPAKRPRNKFLGELSSSPDDFYQDIQRNSKNDFSHVRTTTASDVEYYDDDEETTTGAGPAETENTNETQRPMTNEQKAENDEEKDLWKRKQLNRLNTKVGLMFASKPIVQLMTNPFIGPLTNRFVHILPLCCL